MARLKQLLSLLFLVFAVLATLVFYFRNDAVVPVDLFLFEVSGLGVGFWILASFVIGALVGILVSWPVEWFWKISKKSKDKKLQEATTELARMKTTIKGS